MATPDVETLVIGGGAVGLAIARALVERQRRDVMVIERNDRLGAETTARNSEVIHAGLYYPEGSRRARTCVDGKERLYRFAAENGVTAARCGKLIVATSDADVPKLNALKENAARNGVADLRLLNAGEASALEPELICKAACLSPSTGVIDSHDYVMALSGHVESKGGMIVLRTEATRLEVLGNGDFKVTTQSENQQTALTAAHVVIAAGHKASTLADTLSFKPPYRVPQTYFAKGHYFTLTGRAPFRHLVYPLPQGSWLGVHFTRDVAGQGKFGPDFEWCDRVDYTFDDPTGARRERFAQSIQNFWPALPPDALAPGYTGVRPKLSRTDTTVDFAVHGPVDHGVAGLVALYGIDSPGLTASLALAEDVANLLD